MSEDDSTLKEKSQEMLRLSRGELWMLRIAALTGVAGFFSHIGQLIGQVF